MSQTPYGISWHLDQAQLGVILGGGSAPPLLTAGFAFSPFTAGNSRNSIPKKIKCPPYDGIDPMHNQGLRGVFWVCNDYLEGREEITFHHLTSCTGSVVRTNVWQNASTLVPQAARLKTSYGLQLRHLLDILPP